MGVFGRIKEWVKARAEEDELGRLSDAELKDMGTNRYELAILGKKSRNFGS